LKNQLTEPLAKALVDNLKKISDEVVEYDERIYQILDVLGYKEEFPDFEGEVISSNPHDPKAYWRKLEKKLTQTKDDKSLRDLEDLISIVVNVKKHLGISDTELDNLTTTVGLTIPTKKVGGVNSKLTLEELISVYNKLGLANPQEILGGGVPSTDKLGGNNFSNMPNGQSLKSLVDNYNTISSLANGRSLNELIDEANRYQLLNVVANNVIREGGEIKQEKLDILKSSKQQAETDLLKRLANKFNLNLSDSDITEDKVTSEIAKKMNPPCAHTDYDAIKSERDTLKTENSDLKEQNKENQDGNIITKGTLMESITSNQLGFAVSSEQKRKLASATSAKEVETMRSEMVKNEFSKLQQQNNSSFYLNIGLGIITIASLITLA
jgi:hypothetical protein